MKTARIRLYTPADFFGRMIAWRLSSDYCHATIELDGQIYSATLPVVTALDLDNPDVAQPPRGGKSYDVQLTDEQHALALAYCRSMLGTEYDVLSVLGWAFRIQSMQRPKHVYCFEYVYDALAAAGLFEASKRLVSGDQLVSDLSLRGYIRIDRWSIERAKTQPAPMTVVAPQVRA